MKKFRMVPTLVILACLAGSALAEDGASYCDIPQLSDEARKQLSEALEDRLNSPATARADAALRLAADDIVRAQKPGRACRKAFENGQEKFEKALAKKTRSVTRSAGKADSDDPQILAVQQTLRDAFIADQAARLAYLDLATKDKTGKAYWAQRLATANAINLDAKNTAMLEELLVDYDWIDSQRFGPRIASHAWVLAQHADANPAFQKEALARMEPYLESGGVRSQDYAYLFDRVAVNTGELQRYGTQPESACNEDGTLSPQPLEAPGEVDKRRADLGMGPMADAMAEMASRRCP